MAAPWEKYRAGGQTVGTADPRIPVGLENTQAQTARTATQTVGDRIDNATKAATSPAIIRKTRADADRAEAEARSARLGSRGLTPELLQALRDKKTALAAFESGLSDVQRQYDKNFKGRSLSNGFGLTEYLPTPSHETFNSAAKRLGPFAQTMLGLGSKNTDAASEYKQKVLPFIPDASNYDSTNENKLRQLWSFLETQRKSTYGALGEPLPKVRRGSSASPKVIDFNDLP